MRAIILAAGQGTRLLPFTQDNPKCLVPVEGKAILDWQIGALAEAGVTDIVVVGGYRIERLRRHVAAATAGARIALLCNPFWAVASSIGSVWTARAALDAPFCLLNGDTIFEAAILARAIAAARPGVSLLVEPARLFAQDDMRVVVEGAAVRGVGKTLGDERARHRSLGVVVATGGGERAYADALDAVICADEGAQQYHHAVIDRLARGSIVHAITAGSPAWIEIDRPEDIDRWRTR